MTFFMTVIFMVLVFWRPQEWLWPELEGVPILNVVVLIGIFGLFVDASQNKARFPKGPAPYLLAGLWLAAMMSQMVHFYFQGLMDTIPETGKICFFTLLLLCVLDRPSRARMVAVIFVGAACLIAIHVLLQARRGYGFANAEPLYVTDPKTGAVYARTLFFGIFEDPNDVAQLLATSMPLVFAIPKRQNFLSFLASAGVVTFLMMAFLTTHSRGGLVGLTAACGALLILRLPVRWLPYAMAIALVGTLVLVATHGGAMLDESARDRVVFWGQANRVFLHHPIFGIGYGMFWQVAEDRAAHNAFVYCYTELGLCGYWFWFSLIALGVIGCWRSRVALASHKTTDQAFMRRFAGLCIAAMAGFCTSAFYLSRAWVYPLFFLMALLNSVPAMVQDLLPEKAPLMNTRKDLGWRCTSATLFSIVYIYVVIILLNRGYA